MKELKNQGELVKQKRSKFSASERLCIESLYNFHFGTKDSKSFDKTKK